MPKGCPSIHGSRARTGPSSGSPGARMETTAHGPCVIVDHLFEGDRSHGRVRVEECGAVRLDESLDLLAGRSLRGPVTPDALPLGRRGWCTSTSRRQA